MWGVGIMYIILGSLYFWTKKLNLSSNFLSQRIYLTLLITGITITLISIFSFLLPSYIYYTLCGICVCTMSIYILRLSKRWMIAMETINKLSD